MKLTYLKRNGHERTRITKASNNPAAVARRKRVLERLEKRRDAKNLSPEKKESIDMQIFLLQQKITH